MKPPERRARRSFKVLKLAALVLASAAAVPAAVAASASSSSTLVSAAPWWEKVTVTISGDGKPEACRYQTSLSPANAEDCDIGSDQAAVASKASASTGEITRITFERRFDPGTAPAKANLQAGDTFLGGQMMALAIDPKGSVKNCRIVATAGSMRPEYGCDDASAERFQASLSGAHAVQREGYMTILVYGHSEHMA
jgi:hypothetical protein